SAASASAISSAVAASIRASNNCKKPSLSSPGAIGSRKAIVTVPGRAWDSGGGARGCHGGRDFQR
ncbi:MAG: hypothetical protein ACT4O2_01210, partial [Beijerinckiaceae bacterium]